MTGPARARWRFRDRLCVRSWRSFSCWTPSAETRLRGNPSQREMTLLWVLGLVLLTSALSPPRVYCLLTSTPWQASIQWKEIHQCGGALVASNWVLSSASCFKNLSDVSQWSVVLARWKPPDDSTRVGIKKVIRHDSYTMQIAGYDLSLVQLATPISNRTDDVSPIRVPNATTQFKDGTPCSVTGWGKVTKRGAAEYPYNQLQVVDVSVLNSGPCNDMFQARYMPSVTFIQSDMICSNASAAPGACSGDTGGPLVCNNTGLPILAGILSWNMGCGTDSLAVFSSTVGFRNWILTTQQKNNN
ncbi:chymotrypsinogen B-like [Ambystoma mexicanum]|uniref:chymotrypsinogen B-like n=1 Tax=Ambystoma mexicanum TaxID=8296 RepID=UPI0037E86187